jgi:hypothetical protein
MGVTLHYRGKLKSPDLVADITNEVMDICDLTKGGVCGS